MNHKEAKISTVSCWEEKITLPTLSPGTYNPHPIFETFQVTSPYPYPYTYQLGDKIKNIREYIALNIENEYLKVIILPHLGSRVYSIYDKINKKELIHKPDMVNIFFQPGTAGGTYVGVGMELSVPNHHSLTNSRKREYSTLDNEDGSKTIIVGELELRYLMRWEMQFTLKPGVAALHQKIIIHNQSNTDGRFRCWSNAGVSLDGKDIEFILPEKEIWEHGGEFQAASWPLYDGVDMRYPDKIPQTTGFEGKNVRDGFFAYYDHKSNYGLVHWADPGAAKGKKYWSWGKSVHAEHRAHLFSDGKRFMEFQSGRDEDQEVFEILEPFATSQWDETWYPVGAMETVTSAVETIAMALPASLPEIIKDGKIKLKLQSIIAYDKLKVIVSEGSKLLGERELAIAPGKVEHLSIDIDGIHKEAYGITLSFVHNEMLLMSHRIEKNEPKDKYIDIIADVTEPPIDRTPDFIMSEIRLRMRRFRRDKHIYCDDLLNEILRKEPTHAEALKIKGIILHDKCLLEESNEVLQKSLQKNFFDGETYYYLGLNAYKNGNLQDAWLEFSQAAKFNKRGMAFFYMGLIAEKNNNHDLAIKMFRDAVDYNGSHTRARVCLALLLAKAGKKMEALSQIAEADARFINDPLCAVAKMLISSGSLKGFKDSDIGRQSIIQLHDDIQTYCELVMNLAEINFYGEALELLEEVKEICVDSEGAGMLPFYFNFIYKKLGKNEKAAEVLRHLEINSIEYTFPFRHEELRILLNVLEEESENKFANYYTGLILGSLTRFEEGFSYIKKAVDNGLEHSVVLNTLGVMADKIKNDSNAALKFFTGSLELDRENIYTRNYLAELLLKKRKFAALEKLFEHQSTFTNLDLLRKFLSHNIRKNEFDKLIDVLENKVSFPNMGQDLHPDYSAALIKRGTGFLINMDYKKAIEDFEKALTMPEQFGGNVARKKYNLEAEYFLGKAHQAKGDTAMAEKIWLAGIAKQEQEQAWTLSGAWDFGFWTDRFYQGWMLRELGRKAEAVTYFDAVRAYATHKIKSLLTSEQRKGLLKMAYNGLNEAEIMRDNVDQAYLNME